MLNAEENVFAGPLSEQYELVNLICPGLPVLRRKLGEYVAQWRPVYDGPAPLRVLEIGCGSGASAQALLTRREDLHLFALDSSAKMLKQARTNLAHWEQAGRIEFTEIEALEGLARTPEGDMDVVASSYVIHNFERGYRERIHAEIYRVLKPGGLFINGDRYAIDDRAAHLAQVQKDTRYWFKTLAPMGRLEQLEEWVVHLIHDENSMHIMHLTTAIGNLKSLGFRDVKVERREGVDALVTAVKPL
jgi:ubiquinone/menaquinone biosynthesis C-methylase UbiE